MTAAGGTLAVAHDLTREYRMGEVTDQALRGVDLQIGAGELISLLGSAGSPSCRTSAHPSCSER